MSVLRFDTSTADWVIFAPSRALRPHDGHFRSAKHESDKGSARCPFCPGNEAFTPPEIFGIRDGSQWKVRVVANKFPALRIEDDLRRQGDSFYSMGGCGAHEVIIESPDHSTFLAQQPVSQIQAVLQTAQWRSQDLMRDKRFQTAIVFKNHGEAAGTSLPHPHWQVIATPIVPRTLRLKHSIATEYFDRTGDCLYCVMRDNELAAEVRMIGQNAHFVAFLPFASHLPFETWIMPKQHQASFAKVPSEQLGSLASILQTVLLRLASGLDDPAFNLTIDTVSRGDEDKAYFLWHLRILPRLTTPAGFELGSGMSINTVMPEDAAAFLSEVETVSPQSKSMSMLEPPSNSIACDSH